MGCGALFNLSAPECISSRLSSAQAMDLPDAFFFGAGFTTGGQCKPELAQLHNPTFAGYMVQAAGSNQTLLDFALGFGSHVMSDLAGFETLYLSPLGAVHWLPVWQLMEAQDVVVAKGWSSSSPFSSTIAQLVEQASAPISQPLAEFVARVSKLAAPALPSLPVVSASDVLACSKAWSAGLRRITANALRTESSCAEWDLLFYDSGAQGSVDLATARLRYYQGCGRTAIQQWRSLLLDQRVSPAQAASTTARSIVATCRHPPRSGE